MKVELSGVCKSYASRPVLRNVCASFRGGRLAAVVGPNGAGKTTLFRIAARLVHADAGSIDGPGCLFYGGFDSLPVRGSVDLFRRSLGLDASRDHRRLANLSRGQLHLVGLEAVLDLHPLALLLDEPRTALEPQAREDLNGRLRATVDRGGVVVCSTHDLDEVARIADDVGFLARGSLQLYRREDQDGGSFDRGALLSLFREGRAA